MVFTPLVNCGNGITSSLLEASKSTKAVLRILHVCGNFLTAY